MKGELANFAGLRWRSHRQDHPTQGAGQACPECARREANERLRRPLTPQEISVLTLAAAGLTNPEIAGRLHISLSTAKTHMSRIINKLGAENRTGASMKAFRLGIIREA